MSEVTAAGMESLYPGVCSENNSLLFSRTLFRWCIHSYGVGRHSTRLLARVIRGPQLQTVEVKAHVFFYVASSVTLFSFVGFERSGRDMQNSVLDTKSSLAVQAHVNMLQGIINSMEQKSNQCKQWFLAIETLLFSITNSCLDWRIVLFASMTALIFMLQDAGYLAFNRHFREQQNKFVQKIHKGEDIAEMVFCTEKLQGCLRVCYTIKALRSCFVWPCYFLVIAFMIAYLYFK